MSNTTKVVIARVEEFKEHHRFYVLTECQLSVLVTKAERAILRR